MFTFKHRLILLLIGALVFAPMQGAIAAISLTADTDSVGVFNSAAESPQAKQNTQMQKHNMHCDNAGKTSEDSNKHKCSGNCHGCTSCGHCVACLVNLENFAYHIVTHESIPLTTQHYFVILPADYRPPIIA